MDRDDSTTDTGMLGSETENLGKAATHAEPTLLPTAGAEDTEATAAMSNTDPDRTRLGSREPGPAWHS